ncbi:hypothetical protein HMPREF1570_4787 [Klebsiella oxytoca KA-2]|nr:hypothetical protein HMPREF1570_4787 [Klebsiella oxytoca KA-2]
MKRSPEAALRTCPGYSIAAGGESVARAGASRRPREKGEDDFISGCGFCV